MRAVPHSGRDHSAPRIGGLFEGYGGLTMAARAVFGGELAWVSEYEPPSKATPRPTQAAARLLAHHHPDVPNHGDITAIDWASVLPVDILCGGFPCQDVSAAGKRVGMKPDSRSGLWAHFARAIAVLHPSVVLIENVRGLLSAEAACDVEPCPWCLGDQRERPLRALGAVLGDLAGLGYDAQWTCVGADAVGAPHERKRVFIVAWPAADASHPGLERPEPAAGRDVSTRRAVTDAADVGHERTGNTRDGRTGLADGGVDSVADPSGERRGEGRTESARVEWRPDVAVRSARVASDAFCVEPQRWGVVDVVGSAPAPGATETPERQRIRDSAGDCGAETCEWGDFEPAVRRWESILGRSAPAPTQTGSRGGQQLSPRFVEWMMGLPDGWVTNVPSLTRNEQLKLLGNGVVPQQAQFALASLLSECRRNGDSQCLPAWAS